MLLLAFVMLSGFRAQTIIHDDGSETQDVLKVSDSHSGQQSLKEDADTFQERNYTIMDYDNGNGKGFRAMKTITKDASSKSSVDHIVHKTHDGLICSTYYIDFTYDEDNFKMLRLGVPMEENDADLEYIISFPSGTRVISNSKKPDEQGSTYLWSLSQSGDRQVKLQATVWHKLAIYFALGLVVLIVLCILVMERRRKSLISWKQAARMRRFEVLLLLIPLFILGYMGYEYYAGTHVTSETLAKVSQQQQEELLENRAEDKRIQEAELQKKRLGEEAIGRVKNKTTELTSSLSDLKKGYLSGRYNRSTMQSEAHRLSSQAQGLLDDTSALSQEDKEAIRELINGVDEQAEAVINTPSPDRNQSRDKGKSTETKKSTADSKKTTTTDKNGNR